MKRLGPWFYAPLPTGPLPLTLWVAGHDHISNIGPDGFERSATSLIYHRFLPAPLASTRDLWFD